MDIFANPRSFTPEARAAFLAEHPEALPEFYRYERTSGDLPPLTTPRRLAGSARDAYVERQMKRLEGKKVREPLASLMSTTNGKLNEPGSTRVLAWSIPAGFAESEAGATGAGAKRKVATCPAASTWCSKNCYAKKGRYKTTFQAGGVYWALQWHLFLFLREPDALADYLVEEMKQYARRAKKKRRGATGSARDFPLAVRIHAAGDFFSTAYVRWWIALVKRAHREVDEEIWFWFYTRMWWKPKLEKNARVLGTSATEFTRRLHELRGLRNVVGWASIDATMDPRIFPVPVARVEVEGRKEITHYGSRYLPRGWRLAWVHDDATPDRRMPAFPACPQQIRAHAEQVVRRKKIDRSDPVIAKRLRYPATCEACRLCFAPRMGNIIFGKH